jgi:hypothetical protein
MTGIIFQIPGVGLPRRCFVLTWQRSKSIHQVLPAGAFLTRTGNYFMLDETGERTWGTSSTTFFSRNQLDGMWPQFPSLHSEWGAHERERYASIYRVHRQLWSTGNITRPRLSFDAHVLCQVVQDYCCEGVPDAAAGTSTGIVQRFSPTMSGTVESGCTQGSSSPHMYWTGAKRPASSDWSRRKTRDNSRDNSCRRGHVARTADM